MSEKSKSSERNQPTHIMIDIETLSVETEKCPILSIGALEFDPSSLFHDKEIIKHFYDHLIEPAINSSIIKVQSDTIGKRGFHIRVNPDGILSNASMETIRWWSEQSDLSRRATFQGESTPISHALNTLETFLPKKNVLIWANPPSFDLDILSNLYKTHSDSPDFLEKQRRSFRDVKSVLETLPINAKENVKTYLGDILFPDDPGSKSRASQHDHIATWDCLVQAFIVSASLMGAKLDV